MTTPVRIQQSIRQLETKGLTHTQIARELGVSRTTVVKYATRDYSPVVLLQCLFDRFGSVFPQCGLMVFPGVVIVSR